MDLSSIEDIRVSTQQRRESILCCPWRPMIAIASLLTAGLVSAFLLFDLAHSRFWCALLFVNANAFCLSKPLVTS
jgi:hypothetical protein